MLDASTIFIIHIRLRAFYMLPSKSKGIYEICELKIIIHFIARRKSPRIFTTMMIFRLILSLREASVE